MKFVEYCNYIYNTVVKLLLGSILKSAALVWIVKKGVDFLSKPVYDWAVRKGYMAVKSVTAKTAQTNLENAKTKEERARAIDEIP